MSKSARSTWTFWREVGGYLFCFYIAAGLPWGVIGFNLRPDSSLSARLSLAASMTAVWPKTVQRIISGLRHRATINTEALTKQPLPRQVPA